MTGCMIGDTGLKVDARRDGAVEIHIDPEEGLRTTDGEPFAVLDTREWSILVRYVARAGGPWNADDMEIFATTGRMAACDGLSPMEAMAWACIEERGMSNAEASEVMTRLCERPVTVNAVHKYIYGARKKMAIQ